MIYENNYSVSADGSISVVPLSELKEYCQVEVSDDDGLLGFMLSQAEDWVADWCNLQIQPVDVTIRCKQFPTGWGSIVLPVSPLRSITSVSYIEDGVSTAFTDFHVMERSGRIAGLFRNDPDVDWPDVEDKETYPVTIEMKAGFDSADDVPVAIKASIKDFVKGEYDFGAPNLDKLKRWLNNERVSYWSL